MEHSATNQYLFSYEFFVYLKIVIIHILFAVLLFKGNNEAITEVRDKVLKLPQIILIEFNYRDASRCISIIQIISITAYGQQSSSY